MLDIGIENYIDTNDGISSWPRLLKNNLYSIFYGHEWAVLNSTDDERLIVNAPDVFMLLKPV
jgi:hypothetical protein